jgi:hypothetical protein
MVRREHSPAFGAWSILRSFYRHTLEENAIARLFGEHNRVVDGSLSQPTLERAGDICGVQHGIPVDRCRKLLYKFDELVAKQRAARESGSKWRWRITTFRLKAVIKRQHRLLARYVEQSE